MLRTHGCLLQHSVEYCLIGVNPNTFNFNDFKSVKIRNFIFYNNDDITNAKHPDFYNIVFQLMPENIHFGVILSTKQYD